MGWSDHHWGSDAGWGEPGVGSIIEDEEEMPVGSISAYGGSSAPTDHLLCDGTQYLVATYPDLHAVIGDAFGGDGGTNFNVPDLRGRGGIGVGTGAGLTARTLADSDGAEAITDVPQHLHSVSPECNTEAGSTADPDGQYSAHGGGAAVYGVAGGGEFMGSSDTDNTGSASVDVMNPFLALTYIIKAA